ncbi:MAG: tRNA (adenosine(37)-N6)-dimethylallyltransferase MiaA [Bacteroidetes bacterium]|nr:tRNA (adenosine(37)-N6)-dimethylallyltransferase MiaA [Bacteroidota bacterium]
MSKNLLVLITGPTGVGKSEIALKLALHFKTKIISADSRQFYREIPIGTAQPSAEELKLVPHFFIGDRSIREPLDAGAYAMEARALVQEEFRENNILILCGGSGLYIDALVNGFDELPVVPDEIRFEVRKKFEESGLESLRDELQQLDPEHYAQMDTRNHVRLMRAIEICRASGKKYSELRKGGKQENDFRVLLCCIDLPREELYARINTRVDVMMKNGLEEEAKKVLPFKNIPTLSTVGYKELFDFFEGKTTKEKAVELIQQHSRNYAKRQLTWWRNFPGVIWFSANDISLIKELIMNNA